MSSMKTELKFFDVMDYKKEAAYLSGMHGRGWKFAHVSFPGLYHFVQCQPENVRYQLDYNPDGTSHPEQYRQMFADMGWEYLFDFVGYSYFRKPVAEDAADEDIFCDDDSRWDMMKRIFRGRMIPLIVLFLAVILPTLVSAIVNRGTESALPYGLVFWMTALFVLYVTIFVRFTVKYLAFKRKIGK